MSSSAPPRRILLLLTVSVAQFVIVMHLAASETGLPVIQAALDASGSDLSWILNSHMLFFAGMLLPMGAISDYFGHRRVFIAGLLIFGIASGIAAASEQVYQIVLMRSIMGVASAALVPTTLAIVSETFPEREEFRRAVGVWSAAAPAGGIIGLVGAGMAVKFFSWGSIFLLPVPFVLAGLAGAVFVVPPPKKTAVQTRPFDPMGALLGMVSVGAFVYGVIEAPNNGWGSVVVLGMFVISGCAAVLFVFWERWTQHPVLKLDYFKNLSFTVPLMAAISGSLGLFAYVFLLTQYFQFAQGHTALDSGLRTLPHAALAVFISLAAPLLVTAKGLRFAMCFALFLETAGLTWLALATPHTPYWGIIGALALIGSGFSILVTTTPAAIVAGLPEDQAGVGSATSETSKMMGGSIGIAIGGTLLATGYRSSIGSAIDELSAESAVNAEILAGARDSIGRSLSAADELGGTAGEQLAEAAVNAFDTGMTLSLLVGAAIACIAGITVALLYPKTAKAVAPETAVGSAGF